MNDTTLDRDASIAVVERWITAFNDEWPSDELLDELLAEEVCFIEHPNVFNQDGGERDRAAMLDGIALGRTILATQCFEPIAYVVDGNEVATRMRWTGTLSASAGPFAAGTTLTAWCVGHYELRDGRIVRIEQHDCYEKPVPPGSAATP